jgi:hypothetical protein
MRPEEEIYGAGSAELFPAGMSYYLSICVDLPHLSSFPSHLQSLSFPQLSEFRI